MTTTATTTTTTATSTSTSSTCLTLQDTTIPTISIVKSTSIEIANCIESSPGIVLLEDLPKCPFNAILDLLHNRHLTDRLNRATISGREIFKDGGRISTGTTTKNNPNSTNTSGRVDKKCSLDLSLDRLDQISKLDTEVVNHDALKEPLEFFEQEQRLVVEKLVPALSHIIYHYHDDDDDDDDDDDRKNAADRHTSSLQNDLTFSYRMIDYFVEGRSRDGSDSSNKAPGQQHPQKKKEKKNSRGASSQVAEASPRLAEHRDFGFLTLIQQSQPGIQVRLDGPRQKRENKNNGRRRQRHLGASSSQWYNLPATPNGTAILMGGWCARIRSNGRFPALLHRVPAVKQQEQAQQRTSAVLFCNPKHTDTPLDPIVVDGQEEEQQLYINGVTASTLQQKLVESKTERTVDLWLEYKKPNNNKSHERKGKGKGGGLFWKKWFTY